MGPAESKSREADIPAPEGLAYFPFQLEGIRFALDHCGTLLADEMGIGKTIQAIGLVNADSTLRKIIVVCTASMRLIWKRELEKWLVRPLSIGIIGIDPCPSGVLIAESDIVIVNYDRLHRVARELGKITYDLAILDECHFVKSPGAKRTRVATGIRARRKLALSGTPILSRPIELLPVLSWLDPINWPRGDWHRFGLRYCGAFWNGFGWDTSGATNLKELSERLRASVMIRRSKAEVLPELPPKLRTVIELSPTTEIRALVMRELGAFKKIIRGMGNEISSFDSSARNLKVNYDEIDWENLSVARHQTALAKAPLVVDFAAEILDGSTGKIVIFGHHRDVIAALEDGLSRYQPVTLIGGMSPQSRQNSIDLFQSDPSVRVFIGNIQAAGVGITLAPASSHVVFAELSWVPAELSQCEDRCHRIGAIDSVLVQHLVLEGSLDAVMVLRLIKKQEILSQVLEGRVV